MQSQPPWSDFPFIVLTARRGDPSLHKHTLDLVEKLRNVTLHLRVPLPATNEADRTAIVLPLHHAMTTAEQDRVIEAVLALV